MRVLACTDGSEVATEGIKCALKTLSKEHDYTLLFVLSEKGVYRSYKKTFDEDLKKIETIFGDVESERAAAHKLFLEPLYQHMVDAGFKTTPRVREGHVAAEILKETEEGGYDVILLSKKALTATKLMLGSTLHQITRETNRCIIVVRPSLT